MVRCACIIQAGGCLEAVDGEVPLKVGLAGADMGALQE